MRRIKKAAKNGAEISRRLKRSYRSSKMTISKVVAVVDMKRKRRCIRKQKVVHSKK